MENLQKLLEVSYADPDRRRRAEMLNLLLLVVGGVALFAAAATALLAAIGIYEIDGARIIMATSLLLLCAVVAVFFLNRRHPVVSSVLFLVVLTVMLAAGDYPEEVADGRGWLLLALPVIMAATVLPPWTSFLFAGLVSLVVIVFQVYFGIVVGIFAPFAYLVVALVTYVGARRLQLALRDLRQINRELDARVEARTRELTAANDHLGVVNAELAQANDRLREVDRLKSTFLSMVSHELRTPLSAISGFCEILENGIYGPLTDDSTRAVKRIAENASRLLALVNDLLDQARIEAGALHVEHTPYCPREVLQDVAGTLRVLALPGVQLRLDAAQAPELALGDARRVHQVIHNLVANALKFTESGAVFVKAELDGDEYRVRVADTGPGIPAEDLRRLFERFQQLDSGVTRRYGGTGLGLSISKQLTELMGGTISVDSSVGVGTEFTVTLPIGVVDPEEVAHA